MIKSCNKFALFTAILILATSLTSCISVEMSDDEAKAILAELLPKTEAVNAAVWGKGLPADENSKVTGLYIPVSDDSPFLTAAELRSAAAEVYSKDICGWIYELAFEGGEDLSSRYTEVDGRLRVNTDFPGFEIATVYHVDTARVVEKAPFGVNVEVDVSFENRDPSETQTVTLELVLENDKWYLNSPAY